LGDKNAESRDKKVAGVTSVFRNTTHSTDEQQSDIGIKLAYKKSTIDAMKVLLQSVSVVCFKHKITVHGCRHRGLKGLTDPLLFLAYTGLSTPKI